MLLRFSCCHGTYPIEVTKLIDKNQMQTLLGMAVTSRDSMIPHVTSRDCVIPHGCIRRCALLSPSESMMPCKVSSSSTDTEDDIGYKMRIVSINQLGQLYLVHRFHYHFSVPLFITTFHFHFLRLRSLDRFIFFTSSQFSDLI